MHPSSRMENRRKTPAAAAAAARPAAINGVEGHGLCTAHPRCLGAEAADGLKCYLPHAYTTASPSHVGLWPEINNHGSTRGLREASARVGEVDDEVMFQQSPHGIQPAKHAGSMLCIACPWGDRNPHEDSEKTRHATDAGHCCHSQRLGAGESGGDW